MPRQPPLLPFAVLRRVMRTARFDGIGVLLLSGLFALLAGWNGDVPGAIFGLAVAAGGAMELHGVSLLGHGARRGLAWMVWSQLVVLALILGSAVYRLTHLDMAMLRTLIVSSYTPEQLAVLRQIPSQNGMTNAQALRLLYNFCWTTIAVVTLLYQGGMVLYYCRRRKAVAAALLEM